MTKPGRIIFDVDQFLALLASEVGSMELAERMYELKCRYEVAIGIISKEDAARTLGGTAWLTEFRERHGVAPSLLIYDPGKVEAIVVAELGVEARFAQRFTECEEGYMRGIGLI